MKTTEQLKEEQRVKQANWRAANLEKVRAQARAYVERQRALDPEAYKLKASQIAKKSREKNIEKSREKERENSRKLRQRDPEAYNLQQREYRRKNKEKFAQYYLSGKDKQKKGARVRLLRKYNLTHELYEEMLLKQEGKCAICKTSFEKTKPNIDHCHKMQVVRGLLCSPCNIVLGYVEKIRAEVSDFDFKKFTEYLKIQPNQL